jgi:cob(I)alamin adenosyltransferase
MAFIGEMTMNATAAELRQILSKLDSKLFDRLADVIPH